MKSIYYTAIVTRAYRNAIDRLYGKAIDDSFRDELRKVSHRELSTGFYFDHDAIQKPTQKTYIREYLFVGIIGKETAPGTYKLDVKNQIRQEEC